MAAKTPVTAKNARFVFYDIESLNDAFTLCAYDRRSGDVHAFYLVSPESPAATGFDPVEAERVIRRENPAMQEDEGSCRVMFHDLSRWEANDLLARMFGLSNAASVNDPAQDSSYGERYRLPCDTDPDYDPVQKHPYLVGFNSLNYDTVMLTLYLMEAFSDFSSNELYGIPHNTAFRPVDPADMRAHNDQLFTEQYKSYMPRYLVDGPVANNDGLSSNVHRIRQAMIHSGRHFDAARLNEVQQKVALKRLLGAIGRQIKESDRLKGHNARLGSIEDLYDLLAYNVSDVVGLARLFDHPVYSAGFDLKKSLLDEYPETIYAEKGNSYKPDIDRTKVRRDRLTPDSTSAKFVSLILSPYHSLEDIPAVSFLYPSERVANERGVERRNVLEDCRTFFYENITDPEARRQFDLVYEYYKSIEGQNFNASPEYERAHGSVEVRSLSPKGPLPIPKLPNNLPYFDAEGQPTTCFATFSTGGIHGAEAHHDLYEADCAEWREWQAFIAAVKEVAPDPLQMREAKELEVLMPDGTLRTVKWNEVLTSKSTLKGLRERRARLDALGENPDPADVAEIEADYKDMGYKPGPKRPELFEPSADGSTKLKKKYAYTSVDLAIHEDFTSYYPNMLRNMSAFYNERLGEDRYARILADKDRFQVLKKEAEARGDSAAAERFNLLRNGTKLILNSASGAADAAQGKTTIRANNQIVSMRILGQLFSWRIGQAQTLAGARIISTNTDGLYSVLDEETNNRVLAEQQAQINVEIEPEPLYIVSKDSNNRLEILPPEDGTPVWGGKIVGASGGTLACQKEPRPDKSLAHPAVLDWALARYLRCIVGEYVPEWDPEGLPVSIDRPLDRELGRRLLAGAASQKDAVLAARLFQNVIAASSGTYTFPFASDPLGPGDDSSSITNPRVLQHYNRVFFVKAGHPGAVSLRSAGAWTVNALSKARREADGAAPVEVDTVALLICEGNGYTNSHARASAEGLGLLPHDQDVAVRKIPRIEPSWSALIENGDLVRMDEERLRELLSSLDLDVYLEMLAHTFEENWMNVTP